MDIPQVAGDKILGGHPGERVNILFEGALWYGELLPELLQNGHLQFSLDLAFMSVQTALTTPLQLCPDHSTARQHCKSQLSPRPEL